MESYPSVPVSKSHSRPSAIALLGVGLYGLLTLLADSSSLQVSWPWVFIVQVGLMLPWVWLIRSLGMHPTWTGLGFGLDLGVGLGIAGWGLSHLASPAPQSSVWYGWAMLGSVGALYGLNQHLTLHRTPVKLLQWQGALSGAFILTSLGLWTWQTLLPEQARLQELRSLGLEIPFNFSVLELRNWAPIGHQNYGAGYLVLSLPLLVGLSITAKTLGQRLIWGLGVGLGLVALYTTSSRGGWLGLAMAGILGLSAVLSSRKVSIAMRGLMGLALGLVLGGTLLSNNRLRSLLSFSALGQSGGETAFRWITHVTGWKMGLDHPIFGAGPGSVPLLYQAYRPAWAGQEAEWVYQLHSTPAQIWAEFGAWGIALGLGLTGWLIYWGVRLWRSPQLVGRDRILAGSVLAGLAGYGGVCLTDYQLDIVAIVGVLIVYGGCLLALLRQTFPQPGAISPSPPIRRMLPWGLVGLLIAMGLWITPVLRAWQLSSLGFAALQAQDVAEFQAKLERSHQLAPWEPYYLHQLAWNLGHAGLQAPNPEDQQRLIQASQAYFQKSLQVSPHQEFAYSNLGWLQLLTGQPEAVQTFVQATQLLPGKRLAFNSLGLSLLQQGKSDLAVQAFSLELLRNPIWLTSPVWRSPQLQSLVPQVQALTRHRYQEILRQTQHPALIAYVHRCLGTLDWWQGNLDQARLHWQQGGNGLGLDLLKVIQNQPASSAAPILKAWQDPNRRTAWIEQALLGATQAPPLPSQVAAIANSMNQAQSLDQWIKQLAPVREYRRERTGFGVLSRHIDGPAPVDYVPIVENLAMTLFFADFLPSPQYDAQLDGLLQPEREALWRSIAPAEASP
ncbi:O-antigen ligase family protein [Lyngbya confervoides]|uniref:O-antigen ligase family protein n=1 Tax=Lyngbya confervoides BDU141951 TaxID=1574623 RepID=A0ABD4T480_9CYAN|nr:O-antigen ligase family protein [Lyngbya confervoides]MCM1983288.1 O-antigen ligase family protein [Lyngbya confervoides BDU141951]